MVISWLVSGLTFVVAVIIIIIVAKVLCNKEKKPSELERETRTCKFFFPSEAFKLYTEMWSLENILYVHPVINVLLSTGVDNTYVALSINKL